jgi:hypothetical protein
LNLLSCIFVKILPLFKLGIFLVNFFGILYHYAFTHKEKQSHEQIQEVELQVHFLSSKCKHSRRKIAEIGRALSLTRAQFFHCPALWKPKIGWEILPRDDKYLRPPLSTLWVSVLCPALSQCPPLDSAWWKPLWQMKGGGKKRMKPNSKSMICSEFFGRKLFLQIFRV